MAVTKPVAFDRVQLRVVCWTADQISVNVLDYVVREPVITGGATLQEIASAASAAFATPFKEFMAAAANYAGVSAQDLTTPVSVPYSSTDGAGPGTADEGLAPRQVSGLIRKRTLLGGRSNRGRIYVAFPALDWVTSGGSVHAAGLEKLNAIAAAVGEGLTIVGVGGTTNMDMVIWHRTGPVDYTLVQSLEGVGQWATQRKRGQFGRPNSLPF